MSRSIKKYPIIKDHSKGMKAISKRKIRHKTKQILNKFNDDTLIPNEKSLTNQYDISDYKFFDFENKYNFNRK
jgi:hypothetical protein